MEAVMDTSFIKGIVVPIVTPIDKDEKVLPMIPPGGTVQGITMTDDERGQV